MMKDKRIGQVTYGSDNYGSILQCYALQHLLAEREIECQLIKLKEPKMVRCLKFLFRHLKCLKKKLCYPQERKKINQLINAATKGTVHLTETSHCYMNVFCDKYINSISISTHELSQTAEKGEYLGFFSGSDQIWSAAYPALNPLHFLRFAPAEKRVAYAPSFGTKEIPRYNRKEFQRYLSEYAILSVREESGVNLVEELTDRKCPAINDPVFHLSKEAWVKLASESLFEKNQGDTCLLFFLNEPTEFTKKQIIQVLKRNGLKAKCFAYSYLWDGISCELVDGGPEDFLSLIYQSSLVLTDSFHAMSFALIFNTPFLTIQRNYSHKADQSTRLIELLDFCGLRKQFIENNKMIQIDKVMSIDFDAFNRYYISIQKKAEQFLTYSLQYLEDNDGSVQ